MKLLFIILNLCVLIGLISYMTRLFGKIGFNRFFLPGLLLKIFCGIVLGLVFRYYYLGGGDTWAFFDEATKYSSLGRNNFLQYFQSLFGYYDPNFDVIYQRQPRALFFVKVLSVINILTYDNYWLGSVYFSMFSFLGLWRLATVLDKIFTNRELPIIFATLFAPSLTLWSAGIIKESLAMGFIGFISALFLNYAFSLKKTNALGLILNLVLLVLLWKIKYYYCGLLVLVIFAAALTIFVRNSIKLNHAKQVVVYFGAAFFVLVMISLLHPNFYFDRILNVIVKNNLAFHAKSDSESVITFYNLSADWLSILINSPVALFSGLFRPLPFDGNGILNFITSVENAMVLMLSIVALIKIPKVVNHKIILLSVILYCVGLAIFLALSAPNFGTLMRYKVGFMPFFLLLITLENPIILKLQHKFFD